MLVTASREVAIMSGGEKETGRHHKNYFPFVVMIAARHGRCANEPEPDRS